MMPVTASVKINSVLEDRDEEELSETEEIKNS